ncbi:hypothetical protein F8E02_09425 [Methanoculleus sp. Wushi-C6]|uniref:DUF3052 family protein n=1 Tax=Methanoculleus caldifontis TaxID=2651577 RepID=A0ABU3X2E5_9EURY|nr:hypothetical protein [Methanoculleus sp. Wushi-C6]MDV2482214.1 hypothetical protein [Methanoculleus sp. Wushi-C6]
MPESVSEKMGVKEGTRAFFMDAPPEAVAAMNLPSLNIADDLEGTFDYIHYFVKSLAELDTHLAELKAHLAPGGKLWISWPKGGQLGTDLNIRKVIAIGYNHGLVESVNLRIDDVWTGLKLTRPEPGKVYNNSYGRLPD